SPAPVFPRPPRCRSNTPRAASAGTVWPPRLADCEIPRACPSAKSLRLRGGNWQSARTRFRAADCAANPRRTWPCRPLHQAAWKFPYGHGLMSPRRQIPTHHGGTARSPLRAPLRPPRNPPARQRPGIAARRLVRSLQKAFARLPPCTTGRSKSALASNAVPARSPAHRAARRLLLSTRRAARVIRQSSLAAPRHFASTRQAARKPLPVHEQRGRRRHARALRFQASRARSFPVFAPLRFGAPALLPPVSARRATAANFRRPPTRVAAAPRSPLRHPESRPRVAPRAAKAPRRGRSARPTLRAAASPPAPASRFAFPIPQLAPALASAPHPFGRGAPPAPAPAAG